MPGNDWIDLTPQAALEAAAQKLVRELVGRLAAALGLDGESASRDRRVEFLSRAAEMQHDAQTARVLISVLCDLRAQGWLFRYEASRLLGKAPDGTGRAPELEKVRLRAAHLQERDSQLRQPSIREFIRDMERRRLGPRGWVSIFSLMQDGSELATRLREASALPAGVQRNAVLSGCVSPYIQFVEAQAVCEFTGLRLTDIWRYFRHTWSTPYNTTPGRRMLVLIRDSATENHPVIGIAALSSSIVQMAPRDKWIGWAPDGFIEMLQRKPTASWARWVERSLRSLVEAVYRKDFMADGIVELRDLRAPSEKSVSRLLRESTRARALHRLYPKASTYKNARSGFKGQGWRVQRASPLFRAKRAETLARLLKVRAALTRGGFTAPTARYLKMALEDPRGRWAVAQVIRAIKAAHVGIDMVDITVCGAVPPYSAILGGKLVALLLTSPEIARKYERRYSRAASVIASSMAGHAVRRKPKLVLLCTTSLYGVGSSQYNRLKLSAADIGGSEHESIWYEPLGLSLGYGSFHLSAETVGEMDALISQSQKSRRVNSIFGEGVSPRLRKLRTGLEIAGLPADRLLQHGSPRIVYGVALATNFRDVLMGRTRRATHILPQRNAHKRTEAITQYWVRRWLSARVEREDVLKEVERHSLTYPVRHGAQVNLPPEDHVLPLFS